MIAIEDTTAELTILLGEWKEGNHQAHDQIVELLYHNLKGIARSLLTRQGSQSSIQPTVLVHEAYMKMHSSYHIKWEDRRHYMAVCARAMRQILVDLGRKQRVKRNAGQQVTLTVNFDSQQPHIVDILAIDRALNELAKLNETQARVAELRYFGGLTIPETASAMKLSTATINRHWRAARACLLNELSPAT